MECTSASMRPRGTRWGTNRERDRDACALQVASPSVVPLVLLPVSDRSRQWSRVKTPLEPSTGAHEPVPGRANVFGRCGRVLGWLEGKNHADGPAPMGQDVRGSRLPHTAQDAGGMRLQFANADGLLCRSAPGWSVVPHATTLRLGHWTVKLAAPAGRRSQKAPARGLPTDKRTREPSYPFFRSNSFMNCTSASTPASGNAL
jgi:hypothetical protein